MKITVQWREVHYYCEEVEAPDNMDEEQVDDWVAENFLSEVWCDASATYTSTSDIEWTNP